MVDDTSADFKVLKQKIYNYFRGADIKIALSILRDAEDYDTAMLEISEMAPVDADIFGSASLASKELREKIVEVQNIRAEQDPSAPAPSPTEEDDSVYASIADLKYRADKSDVGFAALTAASLKQAMETKKITDELSGRADKADLVSAALTATNLQSSIENQKAHDELGDRISSIPGLIVREGYFGGLNGVVKGCVKDESDPFLYTIIDTPIIAQSNGTELSLDQGFRDCREHAMNPDKSNYLPYKVSGGDISCVSLDEASFIAQCQLILTNDVDVYG